MSTRHLYKNERWLFYLLKKELLEWEKLEVFSFFFLKEKIYLFICLLNSNEMEDETKFSGTDKFLLSAMIMAFYLFLFVTVSKLNDFITNSCCNSETCLPTNKLLTKIHHLAMTKLLSGSWNYLIWIPVKDLQMMDRPIHFVLIIS